MYHREDNEFRNVSRTVYHPQIIYDLLTFLLKDSIKKKYYDNDQGIFKLIIMHKRLYQLEKFEV